MTCLDRLTRRQSAKPVVVWTGTPPRTAEIGANVEYVFNTRVYVEMQGRDCGPSSDPCRGNKNLLRDAEKHFLERGSESAGLKRT